MVNCNDLAKFCLVVYVEVEFSWLLECGFYYLSINY